MQRKTQNFEKVHRTNLHLNSLSALLYQKPIFVHINIKFIFIYLLRSLKEESKKLITTTPCMKNLTEIIWKDKNRKMLYIRMTSYRKNIAEATKIQQHASGASITDN